MNINYCDIHKESYMSAHVLLNLLKELRESDKMRGLPSILSLFHYEVDKFNKTRVRMLDSIYHMTLKLLKNCTFGVKKQKCCHILRNVIMDVINISSDIGRMNR